MPRNEFIIGKDEYLDSHNRKVYIGDSEAPFELSSTTLSPKQISLSNIKDGFVTAEEGKDIRLKTSTEVHFDSQYGSSYWLTSTNNSIFIAAGVSNVAQTNYIAAYAPEFTWNIGSAFVGYSTFQFFGKTGEPNFFRIEAPTSTTDYFQINTDTNGATEIETTDANGSTVLANLSFNIDGHIDFLTTPCGFTQFEPTYNVTDTEVNFLTEGNKAKVTLTDTPTVDINLNFPDVSGNFVLLVTQDGSGSRLVQNWKTLDQAGGNASTVIWAGGSAPTLTTTAGKADLLGFLVASGTGSDYWYDGLVVGQNI